MKVAFVHPDLGIGGAERLVVDAAVGLQKRGHEVKFYTSHHDPTHCFEETRKDVEVEVLGDFLPTGILGGKLHILFAILRSIYLALVLLFRVWTGKTKKYDIIFVDQVSASIPILLLCGKKVVFYCHFPDLLLAKRESVLRKLYRKPFDWLEELTTSMAHMLMVNSGFTRSVFKRTFPWLAKRETPEILYPPINLTGLDEGLQAARDSLTSDERWTKLRKYKCFMSLNRYERKKNVGLAIRAFAQLKERISGSEFAKLRLIIAGGYDERVRENVEVYQELQDEAKQLDVAEQTVFLRSISTADKASLFLLCTALIYTPSGEHFGIVPVESMAYKRPCIAVNDGGPLESIKHAVTGYHAEPTPSKFCDALHDLVSMDEAAWRVMGQAGRNRAESLFSLEAFSERLEELLVACLNGKKVSSSN